MTRPLWVCSAGAGEGGCMQELEQRRRSQTGASEGQRDRRAGFGDGGGQGGTHQIVRHRSRLFLIPRSTRRRISLQRMRHCYYYQRCWSQW